MSPGNHDKSPFPTHADWPRDSTQGSSTPKGNKKAKEYNGATPTGQSGKTDGPSPKRAPQSGY